MLSNTDDTNPSPSVVFQVGRGRAWTGINDAASTSADRNSAPRAAPRIRLQVGGRQHAPAISTIQRATARNGTRSPSARDRALAATLVQTIATSAAPTTARR